MRLGLPGAALAVRGMDMPDLPHEVEGVVSKAEDILRVLNELEPVELDELKFSVIVDAPDDRARGYWPFERGEIIINDGEDGSTRIGDAFTPRRQRDVEDRRP